MNCCQNDTTGGLLDKPEKYPDYYHTCYGLAGLSVAQNYVVAGTKFDLPILKKVHLQYNLAEERVSSIMDYFQTLWYSTDQHLNHRRLYY